MRKRTWLDAAAEIFRSSTPEVPTAGARNVALGIDPATDTAEGPTCAWAAWLTTNIPPTINAAKAIRIPTDLMHTEIVRMRANLRKGQSRATAGARD